VAFHSALKFISGPLNRFFHGLLTRAQRIQATGTTCPLTQSSVGGAHAATQPIPAFYRTAAVWITWARAWLKLRGLREHSWSEIF